MLRERLREMDLRITELADYLRVSRPTIYKFIDCYDNKNFGAINGEILVLFNYITENELVGKKNVIAFIVTHLTGGDSVKKSSAAMVVENYLKENPQSKKSRFITECMENDEFNDIICYLVDIVSILHKKTLTAKDKKFLAPFNSFKKEINFTEE